MNWIPGNKTYLACAATIVIALCQLYLGNVDLNQAIQMISAALMAAGIRSGITTELNKVVSTPVITTLLHNVPVGQTQVVNGDQPAPMMMAPVQVPVQSQTTVLLKKPE